MKTKLQKTDLEVSKICLGTMLFGTKLDSDQSVKILDTAANHGINFIDTAELYPIVPSQQTKGLTEKIIGSWLSNKKRDDFVISSKVLGPNNKYPFIRHGKTRYNREQIFEAIHESLTRLQTDYIDLYQLHWPDRNTSVAHAFNPDYEEWYIENGNSNLHEVLEALTDAQKQGKIRYFGVCNETTWGLCNFQQVAKTNNLSEISSVQNNYSLLNRNFEIELYEACYREKISLLAYSPQSFGSLSGKYFGDNIDKNYRIADPAMKEHGFKFFTDEAMTACQAYCDLAKQFSLTPSELALSWVYSRPFVASTIIGVSSVEQLLQNVKIDDKVSTSLETEINKLHLKYGDVTR